MPDAPNTDDAFLHGKIFGILMALLEQKDIEIKRPFLSGFQPSTFIIHIKDNPLAVRREFENDITALPAGDPARIFAAFASCVADFTRISAPQKLVTERANQKEDVIKNLLTEAVQQKLIHDLHVKKKHITFKSDNDELEKTMLFLMRTAKKHKNPDMATQKI